MSFFNKINNKILEQYPTAWNTKIVWMMCIALGLHLIYFIAGYLTYIFPTSLVSHNSYSTSITDEHWSPLSFIIMILLIVVWLSQLFKNNGFKNFYPSSQGKLFTSYLHYIVILFLSLSFPLSYTLGYKTFINQKYPEKVTDAYRNTYENAFVFSLSNANDYLPINRKYPSPFDTLLAVSSDKNINSQYPIFSLEGNRLQYYKPIVKHYPQDRNSIALREITNEAYSYTENDSIVTTITLGDFVDLTDKVINNYSLYNFSRNITDYEYSSYSSYTYNNDRYDNLDEQTVNSQVISNKRTYELLQRNDKKEMQTILDNYLALLKSFQIKHNITSERWMQLVYHPPMFLIDTFIRSNDPSEYQYENESAYTAEEVTTEAISSVDIASNNLVTLKKLTSDKIFVEFDTIKNTNSNIESLRSWDDFGKIFLVYICVAIGLSQVLYAFRVSSGKNILFAIILFAVLSLVIGLITMGLFSGSDNSIGILFLLLLISVAVIIFSTTSSINGLSKTMLGSLVAFTVSLLPYFWVLLFALINEQEEIYLRSKHGEDYYKYETLVDKLGMWNVVIIILLSIVGTYIYTHFIKRWKALPEG